MKSFPLEKKTVTTFQWIVILLSILIGTLIRLKGLGKWPLALDEYYIIKSAENILLNGLPQLPQGGYYDRGLLIQYIISFLILTGVKAEFAGRIIPLILNLIAVIPLFKIAKRIGGTSVATIIVFIFAFSIWEIEFARFARMYAPFQTLFIYYIYLAYIDFENQNFSNYYLMLILSGLSILIYEGSIFLAVFNFLPFLVQKKINKKYLAASSIMFAASFILNRINFRNIGAGEIFPPEYYDFIKQSISSLPIRIPEILFPYSFQSLFQVLTLIILIVANFIFFRKLFRKIKKKNFFTIVIFSLLFILLLTNQFSLFVLSLIIIYLWNFLDYDFFNKDNIFTLITLLLLNLIYWYIIGILTDNWYELFNNFSSYTVYGVSKRLFIAFFNYPNAYYALLNYFLTLPILTSFSLASLTLLLLLIWTKKIENDGVKFLFGAVIFLSILSSIPQLLYQETRYTFFLVPLLILLVVYTIYSISAIKLKGRFRNFYPAILILAVFYISHDFNFYHILNIDQEDVNYRIIYNNKLKNHLYRRWDIKSPIDFVESNMNDTDKIIINENSQEYYLPKVDYFNFYYKHTAFPAITANEGNNEKWSGSKLIYKNSDLIDLIENRETTIWYLAFPEFWLRDINFYENYQEYLVFAGVDSLVKVYKFPH